MIQDYIFAHFIAHDLFFHVFKTRFSSGHLTLKQNKQNNLRIVYFSLSYKFKILTLFLFRKENFENEVLY
jgi:hypothetical protein